MTRAPQPEHPRLRTGVRWYETDDGLVVRSTTGSFAFDADQHDVAARLLPALDGERGLDQLLSGYAALDGLRAIALLSALTSLGLIVEGSNSAGAAPPVGFAASWPDDAGVTIVGDGFVATELRRHVTPVGAAPVTVDVLALDGPDLSVLDAQNRAAYDSGRPWIPVFPFGDAVVVGPAIRPGRTACFACFELRWLGISSSIALERQYLTRLRNGECPVREVDGPEAAARLAERVVPLLARGVGARGAAGREATNADVTSAREASVAWLLPTDGDTVHEVRIDAHPLCEICGGDRLRPPDRIVDAAFWHEPGGDLLEAGANIASLVDPYVGIATVVPLPPDHDVNPPPGCPEIVLARYAVPQPDLITTDQSNFTHGARDDVEAARAVALIEAIERYCGLFPPEADVIATFADVQDSALLPTELPLFSPAQYATPGFAYRPFAPDQLLGWTWGWNVTRGERVLVPSTAVWYGAEDLLVCETSNGMAAHTGRGPALHNGALELIERDAFMIHWLHQISPARFERGQLRGDAAAMVGRIEEQGYTVTLADLTTDLDVPVVLALGVHELGLRPALLVGAGASLDGSIAIGRAVRELYASAMGIPADWELGTLLQPDDVVELADHSRAYEHPEWLERAAFLWTGPATTQPPGEPNRCDPADDLDRLVKQLAGTGHDVIGFDISTPEVAGCGVRVVRAIVPGLQPLAFGTRVRLGGRRLYEAPARMDPSRPARTEAELNRVPHCFP